jgi:hypothetical protein
LAESASICEEAAHAVGVTRSLMDHSLRKGNLESIAKSQNTLAANEERRERVATMLSLPPTTIQEMVST